MKFQAKALVCATALTMATGANAAIMLGGQILDGTSNGELFFTVLEVDVNNNALQSYGRDLNVVSSDLVANGAGAIDAATGFDRVFEADANMNTFMSNLSAGSTVSWILAGNGNMATGDIYNKNGVYMATTTDLLGLAYDMSAVNFAEAASVLDTEATHINIIAGGADSVVVEDGIVLYSPLWGSGWNTYLSQGNNNDLSNSLDSAAGFYRIQMDGSTTTSEQIFFGFFTLKSDGDLVFYQMPLPPAVWLLGSALIGLASVTRRRRSAVAAA